MSQWNPEQYLQFRTERTRPSLDLVSRIQLASPSSILDVGCGPGNSTELLWRRWSTAEVTGLDSSAEMLARAKADYPQLQWLLADVRSFDPDRRWDLVYSSATLQWIPAHEVVVPRLFSLVNSGGALAIQVPANNDSPLHRAYLEVANRPRWRDRTAEAAQLLNYQTAPYYYDLLAKATSALDLWQTTYYHVLDSPTALTDWYRSTAMRPALAQLASDAERQEFEREVLAACQSQFPLRPDGKVLFAFKRIFFVAYNG